MAPLTLPFSLWLPGIDVPPYPRAGISQDGNGGFRRCAPELWDRQEAFYAEVCLRVPKAAKLDLAVPLSARIWMWRTELRGDGDNVEKSCWDALQRAGVIHNDSLIRDWNTTYLKGRCAFAVELAAFDPDAAHIPDWLWRAQNGRQAFARQMARSTVIEAQVGSGSSAAG